MVLVFPSQISSLAEITAIDVFVDAFSDRTLHKQVLQKSPSTLSEALICIEAIDESRTLGALSSFDHEGHRKDRAFTHVAAS